MHHLDRTSHLLVHMRRSGWRSSPGPSKAWKNMDHITKSVRPHEPVQSWG